MNQFVLFCCDTLFFRILILALCSFQEIYGLADRIGLNVPDVDTFIENLNSIGYILKKGPKTYQVNQTLFREHSYQLRQSLDKTLVE